MFDRYDWIGICLWYEERRGLSIQKKSILYLEEDGDRRDVLRRPKCEKGPRGCVDVMVVEWYHPAKTTSLESDRRLTWMTI